MSSSIGLDAVPQNNPEGYDKSSIVKAASNLHGKLLLIHGTTDDNVHLQKTIQFAYELRKTAKPFQLMRYFQSRHGINPLLLVKPWDSTVTEFILANL